MANETLAEILKRQRDEKEAKRVAEAAKTEATAAADTRVSADVPANPSNAGTSGALPPSKSMVGLPTKPKLPVLSASSSLASAIKAVKSAPTMMPIAKPAAEPNQAAQPEPEPQKIISAEEYQHPSQPDLVEAKDEETLKMSLAFLEESFSDPAMLKQAIQKIMRDIQNNPTLADLMFPEDIGLCVRALREAHGVVVTERELVSETKIAKNKKVNEIDDFMKGFGGFQIKV